MVRFEKSQSAIVLSNETLMTTVFKLFAPTKVTAPVCARATSLLAAGSPDDDGPGYEPLHRADSILYRCTKPLLVPTRAKFPHIVVDTEMICSLPACECPTRERSVRFPEDERKGATPSPRVEIRSLWSGRRMAMSPMRFIFTFQRKAVEERS